MVMPLEKKKPSKYAFVKKALVVLGILLPVLLFAPLLCTHGAIDTVKFDGPTQHLFVAIFGVGAITLLAAIVNSRYSGNKFLHGFSIVIAVASIIISLTFASFVYVPQFSRSVMFRPSSFSLAQTEMRRQWHWFSILKNQPLIRSYTMARLLPR